MININFHPPNLNFTSRFTIHRVRQAYIIYRGWYTVPGAQLPTDHKESTPQNG